MSDTSLAALRRRLAEGVPSGRSDEDSVRRQWWGALAILQEDLLQPRQPLEGVWIASPLPALYEPELLQRLRGWIWAPQELGSLLHDGAAPLLPGSEPTQDSDQRRADGFERLDLEEPDGTDPLLLVITPRLQVALAVHGPPDARQLLVRFDPSTLSAALTLLDQRLRRTDPEAGMRLRQAIGSLGNLHCDQDVGPIFWPRLAERLAAMAPSVTLQPLVHGGGERKGTSSELALLEALTHEVRTPLATIRTLIRSLLRRGDLPTVVRQRLQAIDGECSEQIDRFGLIFHAAELQRRPKGDQTLARTDLAELLGRLEELWQQQLQRRGLALDLAITPGLPPVLSDPSRLETMLGGLMDRFSRSLPEGSTVQVALQPAGSRLKLQLSGIGRSPKPAAPESGQTSPRPAGLPQEPSRAVGPVLSWNPETGSLQLSRQATQRLFHSLGGRLTERGDRGLTVFFPVAGTGLPR